MVRALTSALRMVDLEHPSAAKAVHALLRPLEILTRPWPRRPSAGGAAAAAPADGVATQADSARAGGPVAEVASPRGDMEAGPRAVAAAERAMRREHRHHHGARRGGSPAALAAATLLPRPASRARCPCPGPLPQRMT